MIEPANGQDLRILARVCVEYNIAEEAVMVWCHWQAGAASLDGERGAILQSADAPHLLNTVHSYTCCRIGVSRTPKVVARVQRSFTPCVFDLGGRTYLSVLLAETTLLCSYLEKVISPCIDQCDYMVCWSWY